MQVYLDTANFDEIRRAAEVGVLRGVTTNPSHMASAGHRDFRKAIEEICAIADVPVSAEVTAQAAGDMLEEARVIATWHRNVVVKLPTTREGLKAMKAFSAEDRAPINATVIFSVGQAAAAVAAGASYVSPFVGRLDALGHDGLEVVRDIAEVFAVHDVDAQIIAAALRNPIHVIESWKAGAQICTMGYPILEQLLHHPLTDQAVEMFTRDWEKLQQSAPSPVA